MWDLVKLSMTFKKFDGNVITLVALGSYASSREAVRALVVV